MNKKSKAILFVSELPHTSSAEQSGMSRNKIGDEITQTRHLHLSLYTRSITQDVCLNTNMRRHDTEVPENLDESATKAMRLAN